MGKITYADKVSLNENSNVADANKVTADNMNEIKNVVNQNYDSMFEFKFHAMLNNNVDISNGTEYIIKWNDFIKSSSDYNSSTGIYTLPEDGTYLIMTNIYWKYGYSAGDISVRIYINDEIKALDWRYYSVRGAQQVSYIHNGNKGDTIKIGVYNASIDSGNKQIQTEQSNFIIVKIK